MTIFTETLANRPIINNKKQKRIGFFYSLTQPMEHKPKDNFHVIFSRRWQTLKKNKKCSRAVRMVLKLKTKSY